MIILMMIFANAAFAQTSVEKSKPFSEPTSDGWTRLMAMSNGNTAYFHYGSKKKGIEVLMFDKKRNLTARREIQGKEWNAKRKNRVKIAGLYEINGIPVLFLQFFRNEAWELYRMQFNPATGALDKEEQVGHTSKNKRMRYIGTYNTAQGIYVEKDANSDNYCIIYTDGADRDMDNHIRVEHYNAEHKLINNAFYNCPNTSYKHLDYISAVVDGNKRLFIVTWGAVNSKGKEGSVYISRLDAGDSVFNTRSLDFSDDFRNTVADIKYDRAGNNLVMLTNTLAKEKGNKSIYASFLSYINPDDLSLKGVNIIGNRKISEYVRNTLHQNRDYQGMVQKLVLNADNTVTVLNEEQRVEIIQTRSTTTIRTYLGGIGITDFNKEGEEKSGIAIMKSQLYAGTVAPLYIAEREKGIWDNATFSRRYTGDNMFMSYEYIKTKGAEYVIFNDAPGNDGKSEGKRRRKVVANTTKMNTICYQIKDGKPTRTFLFGEPEHRKNTRASLTYAAHYNAQTGTYATLLSTQKKHRFETQIAWVHFD